MIASMKEDIIFQIDVEKEIEFPCAMKFKCFTLKDHAS